MSLSRSSLHCATDRSGEMEFEEPVRDRQTTDEHRAENLEDAIGAKLKHRTAAALTAGDVADH